MASRNRTLGELAQAVRPRALLNFKDTVVCGITCDSRRVTPGSLFVAIRGFHQDGHDFIPEALERGACAVVSERAVPCDSCPLLVVRSSRAAAAQLATAFYEEPSRGLLVTGVTGTNGKTTTASMLDAVYAKAGIPAGLIGTVIVKTGTRLYRAHLTTPDAIELQSVLAEMRDDGITRVTMEVSSQGLALHRVDGVRFDVGIFTNITADHLDFHRTRLRYIRAKARFARMLPPCGVAIINADDPVALRMARMTRSKVVTFGVRGPADLAARNIDLTHDGVAFDIEVARPISTLGGVPVPGAPIRVTTPLPGMHNVYNALAAATAALVTGVDTQAIQSALACFKPVERRSSVMRIGDLLVVDDTALNAASYEAILGAAEGFGHRSTTIVCAIRGNRGIEVNQDIARVLAKWSRRLGFRLITTSSRHHVAAADAVSLKEETAFLSELRALQVAFRHFAGLPDAIEAAVSGLEDGDALLLLGAQGMDAGADLLVDCLTAQTVASPSTCAAP